MNFAILQSSSSSEDDSESSVSNGSLSSGPLAKRAYREGIGVGGLRIGRRRRPALSPSSLPLTRSRRQPPPSQRLLLQHQQNRKRAGALELQLRKRVRICMSSTDILYKLVIGFARVSQVYCFLLQIKLERNKILQSVSVFSL